jgi:FAD/FMN-containing dehydrogenase
MNQIENCIYEPLRDINGSVSAEHGIGLEKLPYLDISRNEEEINLMRTLKKSLDPNNILNPGKIFKSH